MSDQPVEFIKLEELLDLVAQAYAERHITQALRLKPDGGLEGVFQIPVKSVQDDSVKAAYRNVLGAIGIAAV